MCAKSGEQHWQAHIERNAWGEATAYEFTGGVQSSFAYDSAGRPIAHTVKTGAGRESYKRSYHWNSANQLVQALDHIKNKGISYSYDALSQLVSAKIGSSETEFENPDEVGNLYETAERTDRKYERGGRLEKDKNWHYYYNTLGNLKLKSPYPLHGKDPAKKWQPGCWSYEWYANGMLKSVQKPGGSVVSFEYDALGRRIAKICKDTITRYAWDGNVLLHEWSYALSERPILQVGELGELFYDKSEPTENVITWVYEQGSFIPIAKLVNGERFSIVSDYLGTPIQAYDSGGALIWERELNIYGGVRKEAGVANFMPMRYQGQYFDQETGLCYNRFRYFDSSTGLYLSQDPTSILGGFNLYSYVHDPNSYVDPLGWWSKLLPSGGGHHIFPRAVAEKLGISELAQNNSIAWYPNPDFVEGSDVLHKEMHAALRREGVPIHGSKFEGTTKEAFAKMKKAYAGFTQKGFLKIPGTNEKLFKNLTPGEALDKIKELYEGGKLKGC